MMLTFISAIPGQQMPHQLGSALTDPLRTPSKLPPDLTRLPCRMNQHDIPATSEETQPCS